MGRGTTVVIFFGVLFSLIVFNDFCFVVFISVVIVVALG
jgi:hypothetical protein